MKNIISKFMIATAFAAAAVSCDYLEREPLSDYVSSSFYDNEGAIKQGANGVYGMLYLDQGNYSSIPFMILWDQYTPFGIERADNSSIGVGNVDLRTNYAAEFTWATYYTAVSRCNTVLDGAAPYYNELPDKAKQYLAEITVLRAYFYSNLVALYGDIPYFEHLTTDEDVKSAVRKPWKEVVNALLKSLDDSAPYLEWQTKEWGRVDKSFLYGLKARLALYAGSWCTEGFGKNGEKDAAKGLEYFRIAADAAGKVMNESGRSLNASYSDLFTRVGQMGTGAKSEIMMQIMYSDNGAQKTHYMSLGEQCRMIGQSGRFPTQQLVDSYECNNGKRIDEAGSGYNPKKPFLNRDPRLKYTIYTHHDTIIGNTGSNKMKFLMELYNPQTKSFDDKGNVTMIDNKDYSGAVAQYGYVQSGVGFLWKKYNHFDDEPSATPTYNIILMRYPEVLLTYAEAKIELNEIDATVYDAIDQVRARPSVNMPGILIADPSRAGNQVKMRQIVRRERKVELAKENLHLFDMRRWRIGGLQNEQPTYGYPVAKGVDASKKIYPDGYEQATADMVPSFGAPGSVRDLNDIADYSAFADRLRRRDVDRPRGWDDRYYVWPIPQTERNKCPWLSQNEGY